MTEGRAMLLAGAAHIALLAALSLSWALTRKDLPQTVEAVPVEIVEIADVPRITEPPKPSLAAAPRETVEATAPEPVPVPDRTVAPPPPDLSEVPAPDARPKPEPKPPEARPQPDAKPKPAAATRVAPKRFEAQELSKLLDKTLPKAKTRPIDVSDFAKSIEKSLPRGARIDARATATLLQAIARQVRPCWNLPMGGADVTRINTVLHIRFSPAGEVVGQPEVVEQRGVGATNASYAKPMADAAKRAVLRCAPLKLPADLYDSWKDIEFNFDPSMLG